MAIRIEEVIATCQRVNATVTGVRTAATNMRDYPTGEVAAANLPLAMTLPGRALSRYGSLGGRYVKESRQYTIRVLVAPKESGIGWEKPKEAVTLLDRMLEKWFDRTNEAMTTSGIEPQYDDESPVNDTGLTVIQYGGREYHGFEIIVTIDRISIGD